MLALSEFFWSTTAPVSDAATTLLFTGPTDGFPGVASGNFTVRTDLPSITGVVVVTFGATGFAGFFTPSVLSLSTGASVGQVSFKTNTLGTGVIYITNNGGLANGATLTYSVAVAPPVVDTGNAGSKRNREYEPLDDAYWEEREKLLGPMAPLEAPAAVEPLSDNHLATQAARSAELRLMAQLQRAEAARDLHDNLRAELADTQASFRKSMDVEAMLSMSKHMQSLKPRIEQARLSLKKALSA